jgi:hypothetical protein
MMIKRGILLQVASAFLNNFSFSRWLASIVHALPHHVQSINANGIYFLLTPFEMETRESECVLVRSCQAFSDYVCAQFFRGQKCSVKADKHKTSSSHTTLYALPSLFPSHFSQHFVLQNFAFAERKINEFFLRFLRNKKKRKEVKHSVAILYPHTHSLELALYEMNGRL